jgi:hypothetical protein
LRIGRLWAKIKVPDPEDLSRLLRGEAERPDKRGTAEELAAGERAVPHSVATVPVILGVLYRSLVDFRREAYCAHLLGQIRKPFLAPQAIRLVGDADVGAVLQPPGRSFLEERSEPLREIATGILRRVVVLAVLR